MIDVYLMISSLTFIFHTLLFLFSHLFTTYSFDPQIANANQGGSITNTIGFPQVQSFQSRMNGHMTSVLFTMFLMIGLNYHQVTALSSRSGRNDMTRRSN